MAKNYQMTGNFEQFEFLQKTKVSNFLNMKKNEMN